MTGTPGAIAIVGFGEAGRAFAQGWKLPHGAARAFDIKTADPTTAPEMLEVYRAADVAGALELGDALVQADQVFCLVPAGQALNAARAAAACLARGAYWFDGTSSSPGAKKDAAAMIEQAGGCYVDMAIMAPVLPKLHRTPVLLSGPSAGAGADRLALLGMDARVVGDRVGAASAVKMIRSILVKGIEALSAECFLAARKAGVEAEVLGSFRSSDPGVDWPARAAYNLERMAVHGARRAAEMREVVATLSELEMPSRMSSAAALWQDQVAGLAVLDARGDGLDRQLDAILTAMA